MRIYIAGPMTGLPELNFPAFHAAAICLRARGHDAVNPAEIPQDKSAGWDACMRRALAQMLTCEAVALLPDWQRSRGASLEAFVAAQLGLDVLPITQVLNEPSARAAAPRVEGGLVDCGECPLINTGCRAGHCLKARES